MRIRTPGGVGRVVSDGDPYPIYVAMIPLTEFILNFVKGKRERHKFSDVF